MSEFVKRFVIERSINDFDALIQHGYTPTPKQRAAVTKQITRVKKPLPFNSAWTNNFVKSKYGAATTHWDKLMDRVHRGVGNPCPLVLIGLPAEMVIFDTGQIDVLEEEQDELIT